MWTQTEAEEPELNKLPLLLLTRQLKQGESDKAETLPDSESFSSNIRRVTQVITPHATLTATPHVRQHFAAYLH